MKDYKVIDVLQTEWGEFREGDIVEIILASRILTGRIDFISDLRLTLDISEKYKHSCIGIEYGYIKHMELMGKEEK